ncbi:unnamed protein product, partial [Rotaria sordida]
MMSSKINKNQEYSANCTWQRNLSDARDIRINVENIFDSSFQLLLDVLNSFKSLNDTDPAGLLLSLFTCVGHFSGDSVVRITNHVSNLNIFLLLIGPSGSGKSKIIAPIKTSIINTIKALGISDDEAGIVDDFTTASLSAKLAKSNVFVVTDEAEKPLLEMGFYSPLSEVSASDRISGCKFYGSIPTSKDTMTYHLEIASHLSFVGATTGRLWHRLIHYYSQGHQSDGFSERLVIIYIHIFNCMFIHYAMPKRTDGSANFSQSIDYDDSDNDKSENEDDISDNDYEVEKSNKIHKNLPSLSQILIISRLLGKREFILSRNDTKKFFNKVRQYQELSQFDKSNDVNFGSRMGKAAEILCKLAAIAEILRITIEILQILRAQNQLHFDDTSLIFIRNATTLIERKYSCSNIILEIQSSSCHIAGQLLCSRLIKMLFALYNTEPVRQNMNKIKLNSISIHSTITTIRQRIIQMSQLFFLKRELTGSMGLLRHFPSDLVSTVIDELINYQLIRQGPYINTTSRGIVHMKSFPSDNILNDPIKRNMINQLLTEIKMDLANYMVILCNSSIKDKQILTTNGIEMLLLPEHKLLHENLKKNYPDRNFDITATSNNINNSNNRNNSNAITNTLNINNNTCSTTELNNIVCLNSNKISSTCTQTTVASTGNEMAFKESDGTKNGVQILDNNVELNSNTINSEQACNSTLNIAKKIAPSLNYTSPPSSSINFMDKRTS